MATTALGYSFAPTFENAEMGKRGGAPGEFPQGSIQVLNFQVPRVAGAPGPNSISPLVGDRPSGGFGAAVLQSVLQTVLGPDAAAALTSAAPAAARGASPVTAGPAYDPGSAILGPLVRGASQPSPSQGPDFSAPAPPPRRDPGVTIGPGDTSPAPAPGPGDTVVSPQAPDFGEVTEPVTPDNARYADQRYLPGGEFYVPSSMAPQESSNPFGF